MQLALYGADEASRADEASAAAEARGVGQLGLPQAPHLPYRPQSRHKRHSPEPAHMCAACRAREARYGFRDVHDDPTVERPRTLCFECFRMEMDRRRSVAAQLARGWNATQTDLPIGDRLETFARRRGRAQIAARRALDLR